MHRMTHKLGKQHTRRKRKPAHKTKQYKNRKHTKKDMMTLEDKITIKKTWKNNIKENAYSDI